MDIEILRSLDVLDDVRPVWEQLLERQPYPIVNAHPDWYCSVVETSGDSVKPHVIVLRQERAVRGIVVARLATSRLYAKLGRRMAVSPRLQCLIVSHGGLLSDGDPEMDRMLLDAIDGQLRNSGIYAAYFHHIMSSEFLETVHRRIPFWRRTLFAERTLHWRMRVPANMESFYAGHSRHRRNRRYMRKLEKQYPGAVKMVAYMTEGQVDQAVRDAAAISRKTYQGALGVCLDDTPAKRNLLKTAARRGWLRCYILYVDGEPVAYWSARNYMGTYFWDWTGYDPQWRGWHVGTVLFLKVLEQACGEGAQFFDFGFGDAEYKRYYTDEKWEDTSLFVFAPRVGALWWNAVHSVVTATWVAARGIVRKLGWLGRIKHRWRRQLEKRQSSITDGGGWRKDNK